MYIAKQPKIKILIDCLNEQGNHKRSFDYINISADNYEVDIELPETITYTRIGLNTIKIAGCVRADVLRTTVGNCIWAEIEIGLVDFIQFLKNTITVENVMEHTIDDEFTPFEIGYYGFTEEDIVYQNPNQTLLF